MTSLRSYLQGQWQAGSGSTTELLNPATEEVLAEVTAAGSLADAAAWGRDVGGKNLRALSIAQRGELLGQLAKVMHEAREELLDLSQVSGGNTRGDAKFDIDGAAAVLANYASLAGDLGEGPWVVTDEPVSLLGGGSKIRATQILTPRHGLAIHINAFNFPAWGMVGKAAVSLLAGMPVLSKPATSTSAVAHRIAELFVDAGVLPEGAFQLLMGSAGDLLDQVHPFDVIAFTGSADTGAWIRGHKPVVQHSVRVNVEADSLNAAIVGPDVAPGSEVFDTFIRHATTELTQKAGQKCTATRRILVPRDRLGDVRERLLEAVEERAQQVGNPLNKGVRMGPLSTGQQLRDGREGIAALAADAKVLRGNPERSDFIDVPSGKGFFLEPIVLEANADKVTDGNAAFHRREVFGPVTTLLPYDGSAAEAGAIVGLGEGSLVSTVYSDDREFTRAALTDIAPALGRVVLVDEKHAQGSLPPGGVLPRVHHGGPGRAGGGSELGGRTGLELYTQRTSVQAGAGQLKRLFG